MKSIIAIAVAGLALCACATHRSDSSPKVVSAATPEQEAMFNQIKSLQGRWSAQGADPNMKGEIDFAVSSNGSIVRETMFPGQQHEMTNIYHLDGQSVVMTHYCAMGNQPTMRATKGSTKEVPFHCAGVSNMTSDKEGYMGDMTLTFKDKDHAVESWRHYKDGKAGDPSPFQLTRMK